MQIACDLQRWQNQGDRRNQQETASKCIPPIEALPKDQHWRNLCQNKADYQYWNQRQSMRIGQQRAQIQFDTGHQKEDRDEKAVAD